MEFFVIFVFSVSISLIIRDLPLQNVPEKQDFQKITCQRSKGQVDLGISTGGEKKSAPGGRVSSLPAFKPFALSLMVSVLAVTTLRLVNLRMALVA